MKTILALITLATLTACSTSNAGTPWSVSVGNSGFSYGYSPAPAYRSYRHCPPPVYYVGPQYYSAPRTVYYPGVRYDNYTCAPVAVRDYRGGSVIIPNSWR